MTHICVLQMAVWDIDFSRTKPLIKSMLIEHAIKMGISWKHFENVSLWWRRNGHGGVSNHQLHHCLLNRLFGCRSKKTPKLRVTGLCTGNSPGTGEFLAQIASNAENVSIWWRHHVKTLRLAQMAAMSQATYLDIFSWMKTVVIFIKISVPRGLPNYQWISIGFITDLTQNRQEVIPWIDKGAHRIVSAPLILGIAFKRVFCVSDFARYYNKTSSYAILIDEIGTVLHTLSRFPCNATMLCARIGIGVYKIIFGYQPIGPGKYGYNFK